MVTTIIITAVVVVAVVTVIAIIVKKKKGYEFDPVLCGRWADLCRSWCCKLSGTEADKFGVRICFLIKLKQNLKISQTFRQYNIVSK